MTRTLIGAALALAFAFASPAHAVTHAAHHVKHRPVAGLAIGKSSLPGKKNVAASPAHHLKFGSIGGLQPGNSNPGFVTGQVPPATTWNQSFSNKYDYAGGMLGGPLGLPAASGAMAQLYVTPGPAPTGTPPDGAVWYDSTQGLMSQQQGGTIGPLGAGGGSGGNTNITQWASVNVGAPTAYGTAPTSGLFPAVTAFITNTVAVTVSGSLPLPTGAATAANQPALNGDGGALAHVTNFPATQPVSAASALPTNQQQLAGVALAAPTATGVAPSGGALVPNVNAAITGGSVSASFAPFAPNGNYLALAAGASSAQGTLPAGAAISIENQSASPACVLLGTTSGVTATSSGLLCTNDNTIPGNAVVGMAVGSNTHIAAIAQAPGSPTNLVISGGAGGVGGFSSGGAGGSGGSGCGTSLNPCVGTPANTTATQVSQTGGPWSVAQVGYIPTAVSPAISISGATTTQLIGLVSGKAIYVTSWDVSALSGTLLLEYGTGTNCSSGTTPLTGAYTMSGVQVGKGDGSGVVAIVPSGNALCAVTTGAGIQFSGGLTAAQQ